MVTNKSKQNITIEQLFIIFANNKTEGSEVSLSAFVISQPIFRFFWFLLDYLLFQSEPINSIYEPFRET